MKNNRKIVQICNLAKEYEQVQNKSVFELLKNIKVKENDFPSIDHIKNYLSHNISLIESWLSYSMDKRTIEGWYFNRKNRNRYIIGYFSNDASKRKELKYSNPANACAFFIYNELIDILKIRIT
jgi:predicted nucleotide-binding protein (sugar kinase/HSP70/actin superfamily)